MLTTMPTMLTTTLKTTLTTANHATNNQATDDHINHHTTDDHADDHAADHADDQSTNHWPSNHTDQAQIAWGICPSITICATHRCTCACWWLELHLPWASTMASLIFWPAVFLAPVFALHRLGWHVWSNPQSCWHGLWYSCSWFCLLWWISRRSSVHSPHAHSLFFCSTMRKHLLHSAVI